LPGSRWISFVSFSFGGFGHRAEIHEVPSDPEQPNVRNMIIDHPLFHWKDPVTGLHRIYSDDPPDRPFATDATKFALFGTAVAQALVSGLFEAPDCIHLHDWHTAFLLILRQFHPDFRSLAGCRCVYTIHNLALQGIRPFGGSDSSLGAWFPSMNYHGPDLADPRWPNCLNPMRAGIRLSDAAHTVSPSYAQEILVPSQKPWYYGGEGLEQDLQAAKEEGRLFGILNGCSYPESRRPPRLALPELAGLLKENVLSWCCGREIVASSEFIAHARLAELSAAPDVILTGVSRIVDQKMLLMRAANAASKSGLEGILETLGPNGVYILLGNGDWDYERFLIDMSARFSNFIFLRGYSDAGAAALYASGDLFLMPSSFEPCGISQMLAMRDGQPCLVHAVGGLKDTVRDGYNGFTFTGHSLAEQVDNFVGRLKDALHLKRRNPDLWDEIRRNASATRFSWDTVARQYVEQLYKLPL
jgi:starch synthase